jgi:N-acetylglutamate synthase-like GNAT family acetyltransferase
MDLVIRRARRSDKRDVLAAVRTIWGGQDRIPDVFDRWVTHRTGPFFVAESAGRVVGMGKLTILNEDEGWLEGGRVAPRWRRRGIATALIAHRIAVARERGIRLLRFSTGSDNLPIHLAARRFGFRRVAVMWRHEAPANVGEPPRRARAADTAGVARAIGPYIQVGRGWEWRTLTAGDLRSAIRRRQAFVGDSRDGAAAILGPSDDGSLPVVAIGGRGRALRDLLAGLRAEAARRGLEDVSFYAADALQIRAARSADYRPPWSGRAYLFEKQFKT